MAKNRSQSQEEIARLYKEIIGESIRFPLPGEDLMQDELAGHQQSPKTTKSPESTKKAPTNNYQEKQKLNKLETSNLPRTVQPKTKIASSVASTSLPQTMKKTKLIKRPVKAKKEL